MTDELLTVEEREVVRLAGDLWTHIVKAIPEGHAKEKDLDELRAHIHGIQRAFMAQAAARGYPELFRGLGGPVFFKTEPNHIRLLQSNFAICKVPYEMLPQTIVPTSDLSDICPDCLKVLERMGKDVKTLYERLRPYLRRVAGRS